GILHLVQFAWKAAEIVDGARGGGYRDAGFRDEPVSRYGQHCFRPGSLLAHAPPRLRVGVGGQRIQRIPVAKEKGGKNRHGQACLIPCTSNEILTSSPTRTPPASSATFQVSPNSLRLILVVAVAPMRRLPQGSRVSGVGPSTFSFTSRVTPRIVRSPVTSCSSPPGFTDLL